MKKGARKKGALQKKHTHSQQNKRNEQFATVALRVILKLHWKLKAHALCIESGYAK